MSRGKGKPAYKEADRIVCGFRYGVEERNVFCSDRFDVIQKSGEQESKKREEKGTGEKDVCQNKAEKTEEDSVEKKRYFLDISSGKRSVSLSWMMNVEGCICYLIDDVIGCRDTPGKEEGKYRLLKPPKDRQRRDRITVQEEISRHP